MRVMRTFLCSLLTLCVLTAGRATAQSSNAIVKSEFIFETAPFPSCHASTIAETKSGLVAAWFGGTAERNPDVCIYVSRLWKTANGRRPQTSPTASASLRIDCPRGTPFCSSPKNGPLLLFYKVGPAPASWWGMMKTSTDDGKTWFPAQRLPEGILGPIKNKPVQQAAVQAAKAAAAHSRRESAASCRRQQKRQRRRQALARVSAQRSARAAARCHIRQLTASTDILCGTSTEGDGGWHVHFERTKDFGKTWTATAPVNDSKEIGAIQPSILFHPNNRLQAIGRTRNDKLFQIWSDDGGSTWGKMSLLELPNPNSGTDAVTLRDGRQLLVYNHNTREGSSNKGRSPLNVAVSKDGENWSAALVLEDDLNAPNGFSYPAVIQTSDGLVHITYTWERKRIKHVVLDPAKLTLQPITHGEWPKINLSRCRNL